VRVRKGSSGRVIWLESLNPSPYDESRDGGLLVAVARIGGWSNKEYVYVLYRSLDLETIYDVVHYRARPAEKWIVRTYHYEQKES
jgi:hypothetical protein